MQFLQKLDTLRIHILETTNLKRILESSHQKEFVKAGIVNVLA